MARYVRLREHDWRQLAVLLVQCLQFGSATRTPRRQYQLTI